MPTSPVSGTEKALLAAREPLSGAQDLTWRGGWEGGGKLHRNGHEV